MFLAKHTRKDNQHIEHWLKRGMASHGYQLNMERQTEEKFMAQVTYIGDIKEKFIAQVIMITFFKSVVKARGDVDGYEIRIRGENSDDTTEDGWFRQGPRLSIRIVIWILPSDTDTLWCS